MAAALRRGAQRRLRATPPMSEDDRTDIPASARPQPPDEPAPAKPKLKKRRTVLLLIPLVLLARDLDGLRDDDGRRRRPPRPGERQGVPDGAQLDARRPPRQAARHPHQRPQPRPRRLRATSRRSCATRSSPSRTERYYENEGVDVRGIGRAFYQDVIRGGARQGGSTITQQFVKNALEAQSERTLFQKLREAALAYHLTRKWSKSKILREYLNSIYFGNGAYGIESAARVYFGSDPNHAGLRHAGRARARMELTAAEAALLAGVVANPTRLRPRRPSRGGARTAATSCWRRCSSRTSITRARVPGRHRAGAAARTIVPPTVATQARPTSRPGSASSSSSSFGAAARVRGRPAGQDDARPRSAEAAQHGRSTATSGRPGRRRRSSRSTTRPARCARSSAAATTRERARSTSRPRASASRARPSSRSSSPRRCGAASASARSGSRASACSTSPNGGQREVRRQQLRGLLRRHAHARLRADGLRQRRLRRRRAEGRDAADLAG